jgi:hypothetical protein
MPDGVSSNIRCVDVKSRKVSSLKTHNYHLILQKLLPLVVRRILPGLVVIGFIQLNISSMHYVQRSWWKQNWAG